MIRPITLLASVAVAGLALPTAFAGECGSNANASDDRRLVVSFNGDHGSQAPPIFEVAFTTPEFSTLAGLIAVADLDDTLSKPGDFTVFAPTNDAFGGLPDGTLQAVLKDRGLLTSILKYHVVAGRIFADGIPQGRTELETLAGDTLIVERDGNDIRVNGNRVITPNVEASNGVGHVIDGVLLPGQDKPAASAGLFDVVASNENLSTLGAAVQASGFASSLTNDGPYTVFAPTNEAFDALPDGTVESLLKHSNVEDLRSVLRLHILAGEVDARGAVVAGQARSRQGSTLKFEIEDGQLFVVGPTNRARVIATNITADNGIAHVIDTVLLPGADH